MDVPAGPLLWCPLEEVDVGTTNRIAAGLGCLAIGGVLAGITYAVERAPRERIADLEVAAVVTAAGDVEVTETLSYDFDTAERRGLLVEIPIDAPDTRREGGSIVPVREVGVASPTAPDMFDTSIRGRNAEIRVGNPSVFISGQHDYRLTYQLAGLVDPMGDGEGRLYFNVIPPLSEVPMTSASAEVLVPGPVSDTSCFFGAVGSRSRCELEITPTGDGATLVRVAPRSYDAFEGVTIDVRYQLPATLPPPVPDLPSNRQVTVAATPPDVSDLAQVAIEPGPPGVLVALVAGFPLAMLLGVGGAWSVVRRLGRDVRWSGSSVDAVFKGEGPTETVSDAEARQLVTIAFTPPRNVQPGEGVALWRLRSTEGDRVATLVDLAVRGWLVIDETDPKKPVLRWKGGDGTDQLREFEHRFLEGVFRGQPTCQLGSYDSGFATAWSALGSAIDRSVQDRGWLRPGEGQRRALGFFGGLAMAGVGLVWTLGGAAGRWPAESAVGWAVLVPGALLVGLGLGCWATLGGLRARSAQGFSVWAQVEGFRQFMAGSEGEHAREAAERGVLRQYAAWAVALDEVERWDKACSAAGVDPTDGWMVGGVGLHMGVRSLRTTTIASRTDPSSSSGGGGGGGSVGGGGGGGSRGSW
ncbi:MAG: DUF2207 domain-containing protein [Acidimicrobiia bacterium]|nr:DUF2207 domain-containing protein [Acidimicrobiia bacterium]